MSQSFPPTVESSIFNSSFYKDTNATAQSLVVGSGGGTEYTHPDPFTIGTLTSTNFLNANQFSISGNEVFTPFTVNTTPFTISGSQRYKYLSLQTGASVITLPDITGYENIIINNESGGSVTINSDSTDTINGLTNITLNNGETLKLESISTSNWTEISTSIPDPLNVTTLNAMINNATEQLNSVLHNSYSTINSGNDRYVAGVINTSPYIITGDVVAGTIIGNRRRRVYYIQPGGNNVILPSIVNEQYEQILFVNQSGINCNILATNPDTINNAAAVVLANNTLLKIEAIDTNWREELTGPQGPTGATGVIGATGAIGATGTIGPTGLQGDIGPTGLQGIQGPTGIQGNIGPTGPQGIQGDIGPTGPQGNIGPTGSQGDIGPTGLQGIQGPTGIQGIQGPTGTQGIQGPTGIQGIQGPTGIQGDIGPTGATGIQGLQGFTGPTGTQGIQGPTGLQGDIGPQGATGIQGIQGPTGATGIQGFTGYTGPFGPTGFTGITGATGITGPAASFREVDIISTPTAGSVYNLPNTAVNRMTVITGASITSVQLLNTYNNNEEFEILNRTSAAIAITPNGGITMYSVGSLTNLQVNGAAIVKQILNGATTEHILVGALE